MWESKSRESGKEEHYVQKTFWGEKVGVEECWEHFLLPTSKTPRCCLQHDLETKEKKAKDPLRVSEANETTLYYKNIIY